MRVGPEKLIGQYAVLTLEGDIELNDVRLLDSHLKSYIAQATKFIVFYFENSHSIHTAFIPFLLKAHQNAESNGARLILCQLPFELRFILQLAHIDHHFDFQPSLAFIPRVEAAPTAPAPSVSPPPLARPVMYKLPTRSKPDKEI